MTIAAYAAAGKSTFAQRVEGAIDLVSMPHSWCLPPSDRRSGEFEAEKGARPFWDREVPGIHLPLRPGEYLMDAKERIDQAVEELITAPVPQDVLEELMKKQTQERDTFALYLSGNCESMIYRIQDIEDPEERAFLYHITRMAYEKTDQRPIPSFVKREVISDNLAVLTEFCTESEGRHTFISY